VLERRARGDQEVFALFRRIGYADRHLGDLVVPADVGTFTTDLTSVPSVFAWLVPRTGRHLPAALVHDVLITLGIFSILNYEISLAIIAAFLTIVGYSLNDTIVVFDRVRENMKRLKNLDQFSIFNKSINESLSRTIITSLTTFAVVFVLYIAGGEVIRYFSFAMIVGVLVGTYSSIYVASPVVVLWQQRSAA
jgi:Flp pilus assembly protein TadB